MESERLYYKQFLENDFDNYHRLSGNDIVMARIVGKGLSVEAAQKRYEEYIKINLENPEIGFFQVFQKSTDALVGLGKIEPKDNEFEIGYALLPEFWKQGLGTEISNKMVSHAATLHYISSVYAIIDPENIPSKKILLKSGFQLEHTKPWKGLPAENYRLHF